MLIKIEYTKLPYFYLPANHGQAYIPRHTSCLLLFHLHVIFYILCSCGNHSWGTQPYLLKWAKCDVISYNNNNSLHCFRRLSALLTVELKGYLWTLYYLSVSIKIRRYLLQLFGLARILLRLQYNYWKYWNLYPQCYLISSDPPPKKKCNRTSSYPLKTYKGQTSVFPPGFSEGKLKAYHFRCSSILKLGWPEYICREFLT